MASMAQTSQGMNLASQVGAQQQQQQNSIQGGASQSGSGSGSSSGSSSSGSSGSGDNKKKKDGPKSEGDDNRFESGFKEQMARAYMGVDTVAMLRDSSDGTENIPRIIQLAIRKQYFTYGQTLNVSLASVMIAIGVTAMVYAFAFNVVDLNLVSLGDGAADNWAFILFGVWVSSWFGHFVTEGRTKCDPEKEEVKEAHKGGAYCIDDTDCSKRKKMHPGLCRHLPHGPISYFIRTLVMFGSPIAGLLCFAMVRIGQGTYTPSTPAQRFTSMQMGLCFGMAIMVLASS